MDYLQYFLKDESLAALTSLRFKPYYKWITFNTKKVLLLIQRKLQLAVLNLIINGLPSIPGFKVD